MRASFAVNLESRDGTTTKDAKVVNGIVEPKGDKNALRKRPGLSDVGLMRAGVAQALGYWNQQLVSITGDYINLGVTAVYTHATTWNPSDIDSDVALSAANLAAQYTNNAASAGGVRSSYALSSGLWYFEMTVNTSNGQQGGIANATKSLNETPSLSQNSLTYTVSGSVAYNNTVLYSGLAAWNAGKVLGVLVDADNRTVKFYVNNALQATVTSASVPTGSLYAYFGVGANNGTSKVTANFGTSFTYTPTISSTGLSPNSASLQFSMQDNGSNSPAGSLLMIKNREQGWYVNSTPTVTQITDVDYPGKYAVTLQSLTRSGTTATATTTSDTNFQVGASVTIAGANESSYNGTFTITAVTASIDNPERTFRVTLTRSGTTVTATCTDSPHQLLTGASVLIDGASDTKYCGTYTITVTSATTFTYTISVTAGTTYGAASNVPITKLERNGTTARAWCSPNPWGTSVGAGQYQVTISGANESAYNGTFTVTGTNSQFFEYQITVTGAGTTTTGSVAGVTVTLTRVGDTVIATSSGAHGLVSGASVTISGATPTAYNGTWSGVNVISTTQFSFKLPVYTPESSSNPSFVNGKFVYLPLKTPGDGVVWTISQTARVAAPSITNTFPNGTSILTVNLSGAPPGWAVVGARAGLWLQGSIIRYGYITAVGATSFSVDVTHMDSIPYPPNPGTYSTGCFYAQAFSLSSVTSSGSTASATTSSAHGYSTGDSVVYVGYPFSSLDYQGIRDYSGFTSINHVARSVTNTGASTISYAIYPYYAESPSSTITGTITAASSGTSTSSSGSPSSPATGQIVASSSGVTGADTPVSPASGTITAKVLASITPPTFTYTVSGSPTTPATGTITATSGRNTVPGIAYMDGYFVVMDVFGVVYSSALNDPSTWGALDYIVAQAETGAGRYIGRTQSYIAALKEWSTEFFYNAGNATGSPFSPVPNAFTQVGCASGYSIAKLDGNLIWLSQTREKGRSIHLMSGIQQQKLSNTDVERILNADDLAEVYAWGVKLHGHSLYVLTLVTSNITLVYDLTSQVWSQWSTLTLGSSVSVSTITRSGTTATVSTGTAHGLSDGDPVYIAGADQSDYNGIFQITYVSTTQFTIQVANSPATPATGTITAAPYTESYFKFTHYANGAGVDYVLNKSDGHVYKFQDAIYQDSGAPINVFARTPRLDGGDTGLKECGQIAVLADKVSDTLMVRWSEDDSSTFSTYRPVDLSGERPRLRRNGSFRRRSFEARHIGNNPLRLEAVDIDLVED